MCTGLMVVIGVLLAHIHADTIRAQFDTPGAPSLFGALGWLLALGICWAVDNSRRQDRQTLLRYQEEGYRLKTTLDTDDAP